MSDNRPNGMRSNAENILRATLGEAVEYDTPNSPVEYYLVKLKEAIEQGGGGGGFTPTTAQLAAMNSGITSEKLQTVENNILSEQAKTNVNLSFPTSEDLNSLTWERKIPDPTTGVPYAAQSRICTNKIIVPIGVREIKITFDDTNYKVAFYLYNGDTMKQAKYWITTSPAIILPNEETQQYIIGVSYQNDSNIDTSKKTAITGISYVSATTDACIHGTDSVTNFVLGTLNPGSGNEGTSTTRIRSDFIFLPKGSVIINSSGVTDGYGGGLIVYEYNLDKSYRSDSAWVDGNRYVVSADGFCRILIRKPKNATINVSDIPTVATDLIIYPKYPISALNTLMLSDGYSPQYLELGTKISSANVNAQSVGNKGITFVFCTDAHWESSIKHIGDLLKAIKDSDCEFNYLFYGGDAVNGGTKETVIANFKECFDQLYNAGFDTFCVRGNHDDNSIPTGNTLITDAEYYSIAQSRMPNGVVYGEYAYFYYDDTKTKTRFIFLDSGTEGTTLSSTQGTFIDNALSTTPDGWHIIVTWHIVYALASGTWSSVPLDLAPTAFSSAVFTKLDTHNSSANSKVEAIIGGHVHSDWDFATTGGIPIVLSDTCSLYPLSGGTATRGTVSETALDIITIDYTNETIKCVRIGRGTDRTITY